MQPQSFLAQFSTKIDDKHISKIEGHYDYDEKKWVGFKCEKMAETHKKSTKIISEDESHDW